MFHRNNKLIDVLSRIAGSGEEASVLFEAYLTTPYASLAKLKWKTRQIERKRAQVDAEQAERRSFIYYEVQLRKMVAPI